MSPYLFILVAIVLQWLCCEEFERGNLTYPLDVDSFSPVLQYADDTLLLIKGEVQQVQIIKRILDAFSAYTGLQINFSKSTLVPINMPRDC